MLYPLESKLAEKVVQARAFSPRLNHEKLPIKKRFLGLSLSDELSSTPSSGASTPLGLQPVPVMSQELPDGGAGLIKPNMHHFMNCDTPVFDEDAPVRGEGTPVHDEDAPVHDKDAPVHDEDTPLHAPDNKEMVMMLHDALQQMQGEETLQGEETPRAPLYMFAKGVGTFELATEKDIDLPGLLTLWQHAQSQKEQFSFMAASLKEVTKGYPTEAELQVAVCCLISTTTLQPILNVDLKPDSRITKQLTSIYLKLIGPTYEILEKLIKLEEVIQSLAALIIASLQLVMQAEAGFYFDTGSAVPRNASQLKDYFEANADICSVLEPQYSLIRKVFMSTYDGLLNASNRYAIGLEHLFTIDPEATRTLHLVLDHLQSGEHWPKPGPEERRADPNLTPVVQTLREDGTGTVYPPFMDLIAQVLESLHQMTPLCEATRCWLDNIQTFSPSSTFTLENQFIGELAACPALNSEEHAKVATLIQHRKFNSVGYPIISTGRTMWSRRPSPNPSGHALLLRARRGCRASSRPAFGPPRKRSRLASFKSTWQ